MENHQSKKGINILNFMIIKIIIILINVCDFLVCLVALRLQFRIKIL